MTSKEKNILDVTQEAQDNIKPIAEYDLNELAEFYVENIELFDKLVSNREISKKGLRRVLKFFMRIPLKTHEEKPQSKEELELMNLALTHDQVKFHMAIKEMQFRMEQVEKQEQQSEQDKEN